MPTVVVRSFTSIQEARGKCFQSFTGQLPHHSTRQGRQSNYRLVTEYIETTASVSYHNTNCRSSIEKGCTTCIPAGQPQETYMTATTDQQDSHSRPTGQPQQTNRTATTDQQDNHSRPTGQPQQTNRTVTADQQDSHNRPTGQPQRTNRTVTADQQDSHNRPTGQSQQTNRTATAESQDSHSRPTGQPQQTVTGQPQQTDKTARQIISGTT